MADANNDEQDQAAAAAAEADDNQQDENDLNLSDDDKKAQQEAEDFILNFKDEDFNDPEKVKKLEEIQKDHKVLKTTIHQKNHYRDKVKPPKPATPAAPAAPAKPATEAAEDPRWDREAVNEFRLDTGLSKEVTASLVKLAKANNMTLEEAKNDPIGKKIIQEKKATEDVEDASITPGRNAAGGIAARDWSNATREEIEAERVRMMHQR